MDIAYAMLAGSYGPGRAAQSILHLESTGLYGVPVESVENVQGKSEDQMYRNAYKRCLSAPDKPDSGVVVVLEDVAHFAGNWDAWLRLAIDQIESKHDGYWVMTLSMFTPESGKAFKYGFQWVKLNVQKGHLNASGPAVAYGRKAARSFMKELGKDSGESFQKILDSWILYERVPYYATAPSIVRYVDEIQNNEEVGSKYFIEGFTDRLPKLRVK